MGDWTLKGKVALLVLHMQNDIVGVGGKGESAGFPAACKKANIVPKIRSLLEAFREKKLPIIFVVAEFNPIIPIPAYGSFNAYMQADKPNAPNSKGTQIIRELAPEWGDPVVRNWNIGIFSNSNLDGVIKHYGAETLVMVGVSTNLVVHIGAVQANDLGYSVIVLKDAVASNDDEAHEYSINKILPMISLITTSDALLSKI